MTGDHLKIKKIGDKVLGVKLEGNPEKPEPIHFRIVFPFGDVDIVRTEKNDYWVHVAVMNKNHSMFVPGIDMEGQITNARLDIVGKHASECDHGDFGNPDLYHVAVRVGPKEKTM